MKALSIVFAVILMFSCEKALDKPMIISTQEYRQLTDWKNNHNDSVKALFNTSLYMDYHVVNTRLKKYFCAYKISCFDSTAYMVKNFKYRDEKFDIIIRNKYNCDQKLISQNLYFQNDTIKFSKEKFIETIEKYVCENFGTRRYTIVDDERIWWWDGKREVMEGTYSNGGISFIVQFQYVNGGDCEKAPKSPAFLPCE